MSLMQQFARNKKHKEDTIVMTARLPKSLYDKFCKYCDEYGFSMSEAVNLLIDNEIKSIEISSKKNKSDDKISKSNTDEYNVNTNTGKMIDIVMSNEVQANTSIGEMKINKSNNNKSNTDKFITAPFQINGKLPCPICDKWVNKSNYSRHAGNHKMNSEELLTAYKEIVEEMIENRKTELKEEAKNE